MKYFALFFVIIIFLASCENKESLTMNQVITTDNLFDIAQKIKQDKSLTREQIDQFSNGISRLGAVKDSLFGMTVSQVIESEKEYMLKISIRGLGSAAARISLKFTHDFKFNRLAAFDTEKMMSNILFFSIRNTADKPIKNIQGFIMVHNMSGVLIKKFPVNVEREIKPNENLEIQSPPYQHDPAQENDKILREGTNFTVVWQPVYVKFKDGKEISLSK